MMQSKVEGQSMKLTKEQRKLAADNEWIIKRVFAKLHIGKYFDELYGTAAIGLCEAAGKYDKNSKIPFYSVAFSYIKWEIFNEGRKWKKDVHPSISLDQVVLMGNDDINILGALIPAPDVWEPLEYKILVESVYQKVEPVLTAKEKEVFKPWLHGKKNGEIAKEMRAKRAMVSFRIVNARKKCQTLFNPDEIFTV